MSQVFMNLFNLESVLLKTTLQKGSTVSYTTLL